MYSLEKNRFNPKRNKQITGTNGPPSFLLAPTTMRLIFFEPPFFC